MKYAMYTLGYEPNELNPKAENLRIGDIFSPAEWVLGFGTGWCTWAPAEGEDISLWRVMVVSREWDLNWEGSDLITITIQTISSPPTGWVEE